MFLKKATFEQAPQGSGEGEMRQEIHERSLPCATCQ